MTLIPLDIPPGCYKNGTRYQSKGRWYETNLCRWHNGALVPVGGWTLRTDADGNPLEPLFSDSSIEQVRDGFAWRANDKSYAIAWGSNLALKITSESGLHFDVTPAGLPPGLLDPPVYTGYGVGTYSTGVYSSPSTTGDLGTFPVARWKLDNWGQNLFALADWVGTIYEWDYNFSPVAVAAPLVGAPTDVTDFVVTDYRIVMTIGATSELRLVQWSDQENANEWTPSSTNQAGSKVLQGNGRLIGCYNVQKQVLILSETDAYVARYLGPPYIYGFDRIGEGCEPLHRSVAVATDKFVIWFGKNHVWLYDGTLRTIPCDIQDFILEDIAGGTISTVVTFTNTDYKEVWWLYASDGGTGSVDSYILFDWSDGTWAHGRIARTTAVDIGPADSMLMVAYDGMIWRHELAYKPFEDDGYGPHEAYALSGPIEMGVGQENIAIRYLYPDAKTYGDIEFEFVGRSMPNDHTPIVYGTYTFNNPISTTGLMGRELMLGVYGVTTAWRYGVLRADVADRTGQR